MAQRFPATYYDGNTAQPWPVKIELSRKSITIFDHEGRRLASWPLRYVARVHPIGKKQPVRLKNRLDANARLTIRDKEPIEHLRVLLPKLFRDHLTGARLMRASLILGMVTALTVGSLYFSIPRMAKPLADAIPPGMERQLGRSTSRSVGQNWTYCEGEGLKEIERLVTGLMAKSGSDYEITVRVIDADVMNAFALPGGNVFITRQLIQLMQSPDELAGVMAHEIGHIVLRHPLEGMLSQMGVVLFLNMLTAGSTSDILGLGATIAIVSYSRDYEFEADEYALGLLAQSRIRTNGYADLFSRLDTIEGKRSTDDVFGLESILRTHPYSADRARRATEVTIAEPVEVMDEASWAEIKNLCAPPEGAQESGENPNRRVSRPGADR